MKGSSENESDDKEVVEHENDFQNNAYRINIIINLVKKAIYNALFDYFNTPPKAALLASLLDSRFKKMRGWPEEVRQNAISLLKEEYLLLKDKETTTIQGDTRDARSIYQTGGFKSRLFGFEEVDEINDGE